MSGHEDLINVQGTLLAIKDRTDLGIDCQSKMSTHTIMAATPYESNPALYSSAVEVRSVGTQEKADAGDLALPALKVKREGIGDKARATVLRSLGSARSRNESSRRDGDRSIQRWVAIAE